MRSRKINSPRKSGTGSIETEREGVVRSADLIEEAEEDFDEQTASSSIGLQRLIFLREADFAAIARSE